MLVYNYDNVIVPNTTWKVFQYPVIFKTTQSSKMVLRSLRMIISREVMTLLNNRGSIESPNNPECVIEDGATSTSKVIKY